MKPTLLDCDTGVDDSLAILLAMRSPELRVEAITTVGGNTQVDHAARNTLLTLEQLAQEALPPVATGEANPIERPLFTALEVMGAMAWAGSPGSLSQMVAPLPEPRLGLEPRHGVDLLLDTIGRFPDELTLIATGPLTNVARAIIRNPARMRRLREILIMGGAFRVYGNTTPVAEFNIFVDPHAAQIVLDCGVPVTLVPLDVTHQVCLMQSEVNAIEVEGRLARFVRDVTREYTEYHIEQDGFAGCYLHDPITVALAMTRRFWRAWRLRAGGDCRRFTLADSGRLAARRARTPMPRLHRHWAERFLTLFRNSSCLDREEIAISPGRGAA